MPPNNQNGPSEPSTLSSGTPAPAPGENIAPMGMVPPVNRVASNTPASAPTPPPSSIVDKAAPKSPPFFKRKAFLSIIILILFVAATSAAYSYGKHGVRTIIRTPDQPLINLPPQAIVMNDCVNGAGKQYVIPKDLPNGPIYDVNQSKVIAVEYNYKAVDLFTNPTKLSDTVIPLTKNYKIDHFTTSIGDETSKKTLTIGEVEGIPIHLTFYVVPQAEAQSITCSSSKSS